VLLGGTVSRSIFPGAAALATEGTKIDCAAINAIGNKRKLYRFALRKYLLKKLVDIAASIHLTQNSINKDKAGVIRASTVTGDLVEPHPYF
jgi:hypothetical protein